MTEPVTAAGAAVVLAEACGVSSHSTPHSPATPRKRRPTKSQFQTCMACATHHIHHRHAQHTITHLRAARTQHRVILLVAQDTRRRRSPEVLVRASVAPVRHCEHANVRKCVSKLFECEC